jgi:proteasome lid subunit RPN8/RPN11
MDNVIQQIQRRLSPMRRLLVRQAPARHNNGAAISSSCESLRQVVFTDEVSRTLFAEYRAHRLGERSQVETGWVLLGHRHAEEAIVLAVLPAGRNANAGAGHVQFNASLQAVAARILRQQNRRLTILGIVHTHPGSLRHPSAQDLEGDMTWVRQLKGAAGIFGIGTADGDSHGAWATQPRPNVQCWGRLRLSWYVLGEGDCAYRPLPCRLTLGPDLARPLHQLWPVLESNAERLDHLASKLAGTRFEIVADNDGKALVVNLPLAEADGALRIILKGDKVRYLRVYHGEPIGSTEGQVVEPEGY